LKSLARTTGTSLAATSVWSGATDATPPAIDCTDPNVRKTAPAAAAAPKTTFLLILCIFKLRACGTGTGQDGVRGCLSARSWAHKHGTRRDTIRFKGLEAVFLG
jgi:hypothetical protein